MYFILFGEICKLIGENKIKKVLNILLKYDNILYKYGKAYKKAK